MLRLIIFVYILSIKFDYGKKIIFHKNRYSYRNSYLSNTIINIWQSDLNLSENIIKICCYIFYML